MNFLKSFSLLFLISFLAIGCGNSGGNGSGNATPTTTVLGTVQDVNGNPIAGADVTISSNPVTVTTDSEGDFAATVEIGEHSIEITLDSLLIWSGNFTFSENELYNFNTISTTYNGGNILSSGLKIFVTERSHNGDFANNTTLVGNNAIEKADKFCNEDPNKPNNSLYKAILADGVNRDAVSLTDWVLKPNTTYYRPENNIIIGTTNGMGIFEFSSDLVNGIMERCNCSDDNRASWTGINPTDFSTHEDTCNGWSNSISGSGMTGNQISKDSQSFGYESGVYYGCNMNAYLYCVEQSAQGESTISINGPEFITDSSASQSVDSVFFYIVVKNHEGVTLADVDIWITYPWAVPNPASLVQFYDEDGDPQDSPMKVKTDLNGAFNLRMDYLRGGEIEYTGTLQVTSGSFVGTAEFTVSAGSGNES